MKRTITLCVALLIGAITLVAKEVKVLSVTTMPQMQCSNCENRIKSNLRFEKGISKIETSVKEQRVSLTYDTAKTTPEKILAAFAQMGYTATPLPTDTVQKK